MFAKDLAQALNGVVPVGPQLTVKGRHVELNLVISPLGDVAQHGIFVETVAEGEDIVEGVFLGPVDVAAARPFGEADVPDRIVPIDDELVPRCELYAVFVKVAYVVDQHSISDFGVRSSEFTN